MTRKRRGRPAVLPAGIRERILAERAAGRGWSAIAADLISDATPTAHGGATWYPSTVRAVVATTAPNLLVPPRRRGRPRKKAPPSGGAAARQ